jgi:hypothetical protein
VINSLFAPATRKARRTCHLFRDGAALYNYYTPKRFLLVSGIIGIQLLGYHIVGILKWMASES